MINISVDIPGEARKWHYAGTILKCQRNDSLSQLPSQESEILVITHISDYLIVSSSMTTSNYMSIDIVNEPIR